MNKTHFGTLLDLRFRHRLPLTSDDVLTGLFQRLGRSPVALNRSNIDFDIAKLASCREWAQVRLEDWMRECGSAGIEAGGQTWREGRAQPAQHPSYPTVVKSPESPRNIKEWDDLMAEALAWLEGRWHREIGNTPWIAENQLYQILRRKLKGMEVIQHARPCGSSRNTSIPTFQKLTSWSNNMGRQHFEALEFFGGKDAFEELLKCDEKKPICVERTA
jgi:hypothetical protein